MILITKDGIKSFYWGYLCMRFKYTLKKQLVIWMTTRNDLF